MQDVDRWGVLTIGTGLGNARFSNRHKDSGNGKGRDSTESGKDNNKKKAKADKE
jgi:hypothetical protein